jgi:hypothetical protein
MAVAICNNRIAMNTPHDNRLRNLEALGQSLWLEEHLHMTHELPAQLAALGLDLDGVSEELERQGVQKFIEPYAWLLAALALRSTELASSGR